MNCYLIVKNLTTRPYGRAMRAKNNELGTSEASAGKARPAGGGAEPII